MEESAYLVSQFDNVYVDLGQMFPMSGPGMKGRFAALLEMAPVNKIMYGSDGFNVPEIHWFAAVQTKRALTAVLGEFTEHGECSEEDALRIARGFLADNARRLYRL